MTPPTSLYVHVPFCVVKCGYCDFTSYEVDDDAALDRFLDALARELELVALPAVPCSVFIGGGTPSYLDEGRLERLFTILRRHVDLDACAEVTMEANPESITTARAAIARAMGVRRMSLGAQSFDPGALAFLDRPHGPEEIGTAVEAVRAAGIDNVNLDLIFGLPGQSLEAWRADLDAALALRPDHLSCYNLTFEPGTRLHRDLRQGRVQPNADDVDRAMFEHTRSTLAAAGFTAYEVSNFAGRGGPCRHNDHYWQQGDYVGVGPGASSHRAGTRWSNLKPLAAWTASCAAGVPPVAEAETLTRAQRVGEALWLGIRRTKGVDLAGIEARTGLAPEDVCGATIEDLVTAGLVTVSGRTLRLTGEGLLMADGVGERLLVSGVPFVPGSQ